MLEGGGGERGVMITFNVGGQPEFHPLPIVTIHRATDEV